MVEDARCYRGANEVCPAEEPIVGPQSRAEQAPHKVMRRLRRRQRSPSPRASSRRIISRHVMRLACPHCPSSLITE